MGAKAGGKIDSVLFVCVCVSAQFWNTQGSPGQIHSVRPSVRPRQTYTDDFYTYPLYGRLLHLSGYIWILGLWNRERSSGRGHLSSGVLDSWASNGPLIPVLMTSLMTSVVRIDVKIRHQPVTSGDVVKMWQ